MPIIKSVVIFILAGICEIGGGYMVWLSVREGKSNWYAFAGSLVLILYGFVATLQASNFARVYSTYGGYFIILSLIWASIADHFVPDRYDLIGAIIVMIGVSIIYFYPRG